MSDLVNEVANGEYQPFKYADIICNNLSLTGHLLIAGDFSIESGK